METNQNETQSLTPAKIDKEGNVDLTVLSTEDEKKYKELGKSLEPSDVNSILNYGVETQNSMEKYSNDFCLLCVLTIVVRWVA